MLFGNGLVCGRSDEHLLYATVLSSGLLLLKAVLGLLKVWMFSHVVFRQESDSVSVCLKVKEEVKKKILHWLFESGVRHFPEMVWVCIADIGFRGRMNSSLRSWWALGFYWIYIRHIIIAQLKKKKKILLRCWRIELLSLSVCSIFL